MDNHEVLRRCWKYGHFWPHAPDLTLNEALQLDLDHPLTRAALERWREADGNYALLLQAEHGRWTANDDTWGPATEKLVGLARCPVPDHIPPQGADFSGLEPWEREIYESYQAWDREYARTGVGSWPHPGCTPGSEDVHSIRINIDLSNASSHWKRNWPEVARLVALGYADMGLRITYVFDGDPAKSEISKRHERIPGGVIGWNYFPQPGTCAQTIKGMLDNDYTASVQMLAMLEKHETGHGCGLRHIAGSNSTMNPSILRLNPQSWRGDPHERTLVRYFGGETIPVDPGDPDDPDPNDPEDPPLPGGRPRVSYTGRGILINGYLYLLTPRPGV